MQRYFISPSQVDYPCVVLNDENIHHIVRVMRARTGEKIICSDGCGHDYVVQIIQLDHTCVKGRIVERITSNELPVRISIAQAIPKGDKMDWIVQKCTELGAYDLFPFHSAHTIVQLDAKKTAKRLERWQKIAKEAAEQSQRSIIPVVHPPLQWPFLMQMVQQYDYALLAYEQERNHSLYQFLHAHPSWQSLLVVIGPEGGFSQKEVEEATHSGLYAVTLGKRILRTETASLFALSSIAYHMEQMLQF